MIAEIFHKTTSEMEDELTGNFFGTMRYLSFQKGLNSILKKYVYSNDVDVKIIFQEIEADQFLMDFWKKSELGYGEIDGYIEVQDICIGIEVKYNSGLSGENQLEREAKMLEYEWGKGKKKILLFVAKEDDARAVYEANRNREIFGNVHFGFVTWENILKGLEEIKDLAWNEEILVNDLIQYLKEKGFVSFNGFKDIALNVDGGLFYEFG